MFSSAWTIVPVNNICKKKNILSFKNAIEKSFYLENKRYLYIVVFQHSKMDKI